MSYYDWKDEGCSCHIMPPCGYCLDSGYYSCKGCGSLFVDYMPSKNSSDFGNYYPDPCLCTSCLAHTKHASYCADSEDLAEHFKKEFGPESTEIISRDSLELALNALKNAALKNAILGEYDKVSPPSVKEFVEDLLSPDLAKMVVEKL